ncbi:MAG: hypothetical protein ACRD01_16715 [Terriglobales bacterium]
MNPAPPLDPIAHLRLERRSFIIGSLLVWAVILTTLAILYAQMEPQMFQMAQHQTLSQAMAKLNQLRPLNWQQQLALDLVVLLGAVALFFLNWRFSILLQRPRSAFVPAPGANLPAHRWLWWAVLAANSLFYATLVFPQLVVTFVLAAWGSQEIKRRSHPPGPPPSSQEPA